MSGKSTRVEISYELWKQLKGDNVEWEKFIEVYRSDEWAKIMAEYKAEIAAGCENGTEHVELSDAYYACNVVPKENLDEWYNDLKSAFTRDTLQIGDLVDIAETGLHATLKSLEDGIIQRVVMPQVAAHPRDCDYCVVQLQVFQEFGKNQYRQLIQKMALFEQALIQYGINGRPETQEQLDALFALNVYCKPTDSWTVDQLVDVFDLICAHVESLFKKITKDLQEEPGSGYCLIFIGVMMMYMAEWVALVKR